MNANVASLWHLIWRPNHDFILQSEQNSWISTAWDFGGLKVIVKIFFSGEALDDDDYDEEDDEEEEDGEEGEEEENDPDFDPSKAPKNQQECKQQ